MSKLAELEQKLQEITAEIEKLKNPNSMARSWDRVKQRGDRYKFISSTYVDQCMDSEDIADLNRFNSANYNTDKTYMNRIKFEQDLWRKLKRFADQNNVGEIDWKDKEHNKYYIEYDYIEGEFEINSRCNHRVFGQAFFTSEKIAQKAIETFKTELLEYFGA